MAATEGGWVGEGRSSLALSVYFGHCGWCGGLVRFGGGVRSATCSDRCSQVAPPGVFGPVDVIGIAAWYSLSIWGESPVDVYSCAPKWYWSRPIVTAAV